MLYLKADALLCGPRRRFSPLVSCCGRRSAWVEAIISEQKRWEAMHNRQEPLTVDMIFFVCTLVAREDQDSLIEALLDRIIVNIYTGNRKSEWTQEHKLGKKNNFVTWDKSIGGDVFKDEDVEFMEIRYRFQKNKENGQKIKYSKSSNTKLCPVRAGLRIRRRAQRLRVRAHTPIAMYSFS
eukprot:15346661-Ditylum_brightwellii.AAC.1